MSMAKIMLLGNLGRDPETRYTPNGRMNVSFSMATNRKWTDQQGQPQERTTWFRVTAWGKLAETIDKLTQDGYVSKGSQVFVSGRLETSEYQDSNGVSRTSLEVTADELQLTGSRGDRDSQAGGRRDSQDGPRAEGTSFEPQDIDDIPF
ncbi:single-stranded DNA-binding protein [soil metagenome]